MQTQNVNRFPNIIITGLSFSDFFLLVAGFQIFSRVFHADYKYNLVNQVWQTIYLLFQWDDLSEPRDRGHRKQVTSSIGIYCCPMVIWAFSHSRWVPIVHFSKIISLKISIIFFILIIFHLRWVALFTSPANRHCLPLFTSLVNTV